MSSSDPVRRGLGLLATLLVLSACGGEPAEPAKAPEAPPPAATAATPASNAPLGALCVRHHARERECVSEYLDALVALRVEVDMPKGIAAEAAKEGLPALVARARQEWERDTAPEKLDAMCGALDAQVPKERVSALLAQGERCLAMSDCRAFAACEVADQRSYVESGDTH